MSERELAGTATARFWPNYEVIELRTIQEVKHIFGPDGANVDKFNWCLVGLAGLHGTYMTLDDLEAVFEGEHPKVNPTADGKAYVSILVIHPRLTTFKYGEIPITAQDIPYLRTLVSKTLAEIQKSQEGSQ